MIYLFESKLPQYKLLHFALCDIYGLGKFHTSFTCKKLGFSKNLTVIDLSKEQISRLVKYIESLDILIAGDLLKAELLIAQKLVLIKSYRGLRRYQGLPVRGQRTHSNAKTSRKKLK